MQTDRFLFYVFYLYPDKTGLISHYVSDCQGISTYELKIQVSYQSILCAKLL